MLLPSLSPWTVLICASFAWAAYSDIKERRVADIVWVPAVLGIIEYIAQFSYWYLIVPISILPFLIAGYKLKKLEEADIIAAEVIAFNPYPAFWYLLLSMILVVIAGHLIYLWITHTPKDRVISLAEYVQAKNKWMPKHYSRSEVLENAFLAPEKNDDLEVTYCFPIVAYLGIGFLLYAAVMAFL
jgi:hypothetical protein